MTFQNAQTFVLTMTVTFFIYIVVPRYSFQAIFSSMSVNRGRAYTLFPLIPL
jgi:hypothetical protein